jgi:hypothetical protein
LLDQQQSIMQDDSVRELNKTPDNRDSIEAAVNKVTREARAASVSREAGQWRQASSEYAAQNRVASSATPVKNKRDDLFSPRIEEIHKGKIPGSLESIRCPPVSSPPIEVTSLRHMILEAVRVIHVFSKYHLGPRRRTALSARNYLLAECSTLDSRPFTCERQTRPRNSRVTPRCTPRRRRGYFGYHPHAA